MPSASQSGVTLSVPKEAASIGDTWDDGKFHLLLGLSPEMNSVIEALGRRHNDTKAEVLNKAVSLYKYLADQVDQGKRVGTATEDQELDTELKGL